MSRSSENFQHQAEHTRSRRQTPVFAYLAILFAVAFLLLLLAYFQQQRSNLEATDALKQSASAVESIQLLMEDNEKLREQVAGLQAEAEDLRGQVTELEGVSQRQSAYLSATAGETEAMQWFWQIESAYVQNRYATTRDLIKKFEAAGLKEYLSKNNITGTLRFSPYDRYEEIYKALY